MVGRQAGDRREGGRRVSGASRRQEVGKSWERVGWVARHRWGGWQVIGKGQVDGVPQAGMAGGRVASHGRGSGGWHTMVIEGRWKSGILWEGVWLVHASFWGGGVTFTW